MTASPQQPSTVEALVAKIEKDVRDDVANHVNGNKSRDPAITRIEAIAAINELRRQDMEYVIGKNVAISNWKNNTNRQASRNHLRAEQRARMKERLNEPE